MYERMLNKHTVPTMDDLIAHAGENGALFARLCGWISDTFGAQQTIVFPYGSRYGWGVAHRKKKKLICNVFAERDAFTVMAHLSDAQFARVYARLGVDARMCVDDKYPCGNGGWVHFRVTDTAHLEDAMLLVHAKFE